MKKKEKKKRGFFPKLYISLVEQIRRDKKAFFVFALMQLITTFVFVRAIMLGNWESAVVCIMAFILFYLPPIVEKSIKIDLPTTMEIVVYVFVFCSEILGEIESFYIKYPFWDTMLHTINGFMFAAFGFCLIDIFNRNERFRFKVSPGFLAVVAFCFSMTIGVIWEFAEFSMDRMFKIDMQKDTKIESVDTVYLDDSASNTVIHINNIEETRIKTADGKEVVIEGGYLDVGIRDTMADLFVNLLGAAVFCSIGYVYAKHHGKGAFAASLIPVIEEDVADTYKDPEVVVTDSEVENA